ncbi:hypothetical protein Hanom_Chr06g00483951 [Helianthus anomalus]
MFEESNPCVMNTKEYNKNKGMYKFKMPRTLIMYTIQPPNAYICYKLEYI